MNLAARRELRLELVGRIPGRYSPWFHLLFPLLVGLGIVAAALHLLHHSSAVDVAAIPFFVFAANGLEWATHKGLLHRRLRPLSALYQGHSQHHAVYVVGDMALSDPRELKLVLLPMFAVLYLMTVAAGVAGLLSLAGQRNLGLVWLVTSVLYLLAYEWLHLLWHLPASSPVGRLALVRRLSRHHALHHAPGERQRWNFNITLPLWDLLAGTDWRRRRVLAPARERF